MGARQVSETFKTPYVEEEQAARLIKFGRFGSASRGQQVRTNNTLAGFSSLPLGDT